VATISLSDNETRREFTDLIPVFNMSLTHRHVGVRYAACQCIRALSRAVAVIRTSIVDSGVGMTVFQVFKTREEHRSVTYAALSAVCNLVNEFSPLRPVSWIPVIITDDASYHPPDISCARPDASFTGAHDIGRRQF
jgi:hypothetical protein